MDVRSTGSQEKIIALLELDSTTVNPNGTFLNQAMIESLKEQGVTDVFFFSTMYTENHEQNLDLTRNPHGYSRSQNVITALKKQGLKVHAVYIPSDLIEEGKDYSAEINPTQQSNNRLPSDQLTGKLETAQLGQGYRKYEKRIPSI